ncbi:MAG: hypothetical protein KOO66_13430 [Bacteroidales bacterium]|nr:hypothetical protein [Bacteroidales bacterium]
MKNFKYTVSGFILLSIVFLIINLLEIDVFEINLNLFNRYEIQKVNGAFLIFPVSILLVIIDLINKQCDINKQKSIEIEKQEEIYKAMLSATHHILNNFLNHMQLFRLIAEDTPGLKDDAWSLFEKSQEDAAIQIEALSKLTNISEASINDSVKPKFKK